MAAWLCVVWLCVERYENEYINVGIVFRDQKMKIVLAGGCFWLHNEKNTDSSSIGLIRN